jgi:hypothetical protein
VAEKAHRGVITASKGRPPRVRRAGSREWKEAPVGTRVYGGDSIRSEDGEAAIRYRDNTTAPIRRGSLVEIEPEKPQKVKKKRPVASGVASFSAQDAGDAMARSKEED